VPHVREQVLQLVKSVCAQSTGQEMKHAAVCDCAPQATPPEAWRCTLRLRVRKPALHVAEQALQPPHFIMMQSAAQGLVVQSRAWTVGPQAVPPTPATSVSRVRYCRPGPQAVVHSP